MLNRPRAASKLMVALGWAALFVLLSQHCNAAALGHFLDPHYAAKAKAVLPILFDQQLIVCNAVPSNSSVAVEHNGKAAQADARGINFKECRYISGRVQSWDKLDFVFDSPHVRGRFQVSKLPESNALLLLVVEKRDSESPSLSFRSFAFPLRSDSQTAQLAIIDAYRGVSSQPRLRMDDHVNSRERKTVSKRVEFLNFNRIYSVEAGTYDGSISDHALDTEAGRRVVNQSSMLMHLAKGHNYVLLRTGDAKFAGQSLVLFPGERSSSENLHICRGTLLVLFVTVFWRGS